MNMTTLEKEYNIVDFTTLFHEFDKGIQELENLEKKFKRKKIEFNQEVIPYTISHLKSQRAKYFRLLRDLFKLNTKEEPEEEKKISDELTYLIHNKYGVMNKIMEWESNTLDQQNQ